MGIQLHPQHLKRYKDIGRLLLKYGRSDLVKSAGLDVALDGDAAGVENGPPPAAALELADDLERLGPTYIKFGQLLSTRADLIPEPYLQALARLQDRVEPFSFDIVEETVSTELGVRISKAFATFDDTPLASASLGQVHRATLRDGRQVAVKVQRPGIRDQIVADMEVIEGLAEFLDDHTDVGRRYGFAPMVAEFRKVILRELDYRLEARNLLTLGHNLARFDAIVVPRPIQDYTNTRVLTMEFVPGRKVTSLGPLGGMDIDGEYLADVLFEAYLQQILADGFFHADPHPGNVLLTPDGRVALIDLGMVSRVPRPMQDALLRILLAVSDGRGADVAEVLIGIGEQTADFDATIFAESIGALLDEHQNVSLAELQPGRVVMELSRIAADAGLRTPPTLAMLGKALLNLDQVAETLDPGFEPQVAVRRHVAKIMQGHMWHDASQGHAMAALLESKEFMERLPARANKLLSSLADNRFKVNIDAIDEEALIGGIEKIANRVTIGIILAAMILGAALVMRVETSHELFGYPALATVLFIAAAAGATTLMFSIVFKDRARRRGR